MLGTENAELVLALPSKGALYDGTLQCLTDAGMGLAWGTGRQYISKLSYPAGVTVLLLRAEEIPFKIADGTAHAGITGLDIFHERQGQIADVAMLQRELGFGRARLVAAIPEEWVDIETMGDLIRLLPRFRERHFRSLHIATKFPNLTRKFFSERHLARDFTIVQSLGATEAAPASGVADIIVDLTSTGTTLRENRLREIAGGTVLDSQACLIANRRRRNWPEERLCILRDFLDILEASQLAKSLHSVSARLNLEGVDELERRGAEIGMIAVQIFQCGPRASVELLLPRKALMPGVKLLRSLGATNVVLSKPRALFGECSQWFTGFEAGLE